MLNTIIIGERTISNELMSDLLIELWQEQFKLYSKVEKIYFNDSSCNSSFFRYMQASGD